MAAYGGTFRLGDESALVAMTGATMPLHIDGRRISHATSVNAPPFAEIEVRAADHGVYGYLSFGGGIATEPVLGSRSTHVRALLGGLNGRAIARGDLLPIGPHPSYEPRQLAESEPRSPAAIRVVAGLHVSRFVEATLDEFTGSPLIMGAQRDRMGARLVPHRPLKALDSGSLPSTPVVLGDIQVPGDGFPVVLLADRQPTGGYPRIATVVSADIGRFAQIASGETVSFSQVSFDEAHDLYLTYRTELETDRTVQAGTGALLGHNLISGFTVGDNEE